MIIHYRIIDNFEKGYTIGQLSEKYNIPRKELRNKIKEYYYKKNDLKKYKRITYDNKNNNVKINLDNIVIDFEMGMGSRQLAKKYNVTRWTLNKILEEHYKLLDMLDYYENVKERRKYKTEGKLKYILTKEMKRDFDDGETPKAISKKYGIPYTSLRRLFIKEGLIGSVGGKNV